MSPAPILRQQAQVGLETTEGTAATVTKRFTSFGLEPSMNISTGSVRPVGQTAATQGWIAFEDSAFSVEGGVLSYDESVYILESAFKKVTATTPTGGTTARERVYTISQFQSDAYQSYTVEVGDPNGAGARGQKALGVSANEFGFEVSSADEIVSMSGSFLGGKLADQAITTTGVTGTDFRPVLPQHCKVYYATTGAGLAAPTEITNEFTASFSMTDRRALYRFLGKTDGTHSGTVETAPGLELDLTLADEATPVDTFMTRARAGDKIFFRIKFTGPVIEGAINHEFTFDCCAVLRDGPGRADEQEILARTFPYQLAYDATWDKVCELRVVNTLAAL